MAIPQQPTLPIPASHTEQELNYMDESPPGLFPENQDSNFGFLIRKAFTDQIALLANQMAIMYSERFVATATQYLDVWKKEVGLPVDPTAQTVAQRRTAISNRLIKGPFTRARRASIVETFVEATFGTSVEITPTGVVLSPGGVPLYADVGSVSSAYVVVENVEDFSYKVYILDSVDVDLAGLNRELFRATPAGINFTIEQVPSVDFLVTEDGIPLIAEDGSMLIGED